MSNLLPNDWEITTLEKNSQLITDGSHFSPITSECGFPIATVQNMADREINISSCRKISKMDFDNLVKGNCSPEYDDVLFSKDGTIGKTFVYKQKQKIVLLSSIAIIRLKKNQINPDYCTQYLQSSLFYSQLENAKSGSAIRRVVLKDIKQLELPMPPLHEQQKIAAILTSVDDVIEKTQAQINKLKDLKTGMMQELLTRGVGIDGKPHTEFKDSPVGRIPKGWDVKSLGDLSSFITSGSRGWAQYYSESGAIFIRIGNLTREHINFRFKDIIRVSPPESAEGKRTLVQTGDVLISITADLGVIAVVNESLEKAYVNQHVALVRLKDIAISRWVGHYLAFEQTQKQFSANNDSGAKAGLNLTAIRNTFVALPSESEILSIVKTLDSIDDLISKKRNKLVTLNNTKKALMQDLLTGKVRVNVD
ncbi:restriction endonuclease subunit S [Photobacterium damselae]|uniref:restriction endonuclease subunit S n=1 Tax=Photobacterium damselae TaxID=38293 RepID=UPI001EFE8658|nr:restriction endonuclease subunit S [Photobacterium damselae]MCG9706755.1 restriction endonuclease subunit S [Photobacterium damselae]